MTNECSKDPQVYNKYENVRCADPHTNWLVVILLAFFVLLTNIVIVALVELVF